MHKNIWEKGLVSTDWLASSLERPNIKIIDATWSVTQPAADDPPTFIPEALFFDLGHLKSVTPLGAAYPPEDIFVSMVRNLGLKNTDEIIIYDRLGTFSAPRLWWTFKAFGHETVAVLRDGLPAWIKAGHVVSDTAEIAVNQSNFVAKPTRVRGVTLNDVLATRASETQIIDARSADRFYARSPEPRAGLKSGHIPNSLSLPLQNLKNDDGTLLDEVALRLKIKEAGIDLAKPITTSCGSGVTAAALALIFRSIGKNDVSVYTGSWAEYGASGHPVETT